AGAVFGVLQLPAGPAADPPPLLRGGAVTGEQVHHGADRSPAVVDIQAAPAGPHRAIRLDGPLLRPVPVAGPDLDLVAVRHAAVPVVQAPPSDLRQHGPGGQRPFLAGVAVTGIYPQRDAVRRARIGVVQARAGPAG